MLVSKATGFVEIIREVTIKRRGEAITDLIKSIFFFLVGGPHCSEGKKKCEKDIGYSKDS